MEFNDKKYNSEISTKNETRMRDILTTTKWYCHGGGELKSPDLEGNWSKNNVSFYGLSSPWI